MSTDFQNPRASARGAVNRKKDAALSQPVNADKWERQRNAERITLQDRKTVPHLNSTMGGRYEGKELSYRGRQ